MAKKLLNEATIRRFQSLANISPVNEMKSYMRDDDKEEMEEVKHGDEEKEKMEEAVYEAEEDEKMEEGTYMEKDETPADDEMGDMGMGDMDMDGMDVDLTDEEAQVLIQLGEKLAAAMGDGADDMDMPDMDPMDGDEEP